MIAKTEGDTIVPVLTRYFRRPVEGPTLLHPIGPIGGHRREGIGRSRP